MVKRCWSVIWQHRFKSRLARATTVGTLNECTVLLIERLHLISLMSIVKSNRTWNLERGEVGDFVAQWLSAVGQ